MSDQELLNIYNTAYKEEFDKHFQIAHSHYENARDKKYAIKIGLGMVGLLFIFRDSSELEKEITSTYKHHYKLGGSVVDTIRSIPSIIQNHKAIDKEWHETHKNEISIKFKKFLGFIPYGKPTILLKPSIRMGSPFENLDSENEIAEELGRQRAIFDLLDQLKAKYIELGGLEEFGASDASPIALETLMKLKVALSQNDLLIFFEIIKSVFASMSYDMKITEGYFHSHIHFLLTLLDIKILSELETNKGRIDAVIETENYLHIFEFKQNDSTIAIEQIKSKQYFQRFFTTSKKIILVGVAVDTDERNIIDFQFQSYQ